MTLIQGGKSNDGNVTGLDLSTVRASNGTHMYAFDEQNRKQDYLVEAEQRVGGVLIGSGNYANPTPVINSPYEHSETANRNVIGAHDDIYIRTLTLAEAIAEDAPVGTRYIISDRAGKLHIVSAGSANEIDKHLMLSGNTLNLVQDSRVYLPEAYSVIFDDFTKDYTANMARIFDVMDGVGGTIYIGGFVNAVFNPDFTNPTSVKLVGDTFRYGGIRLPSGKSEYAIDFDNDKNARLSAENFIVDGNRAGSPNGGGIAIRRQYVESFDHVGTLETGTLGGWLLEASNNNTLDSCYSIRSDGKGFDTIRGKAGTSNPESRCINNTFVSCDAEDLVGTAFDFSNARNCTLITPWVEYREVFQGTKPTNSGGQTAIVVNDISNTIISPTIRGSASANKIKTMIRLGTGALSTIIINVPHNNGIASDYALHVQSTSSNSNIQCYSSFNINSNAALGSDYYNENSDDTLLIHRGKEFSEIRTERIRAPSGKGVSIEGFGGKPISLSTGGVERFTINGYTITSNGSTQLISNSNSNTVTLSGGSTASSTSGGLIVLRGASASNAGEVEIAATPGSSVVLSNIPSSSAGLRAGSLYKEGGFIKIV